MQDTMASEVSLDAVGVSPRPEQPIRPLEFPPDPPINWGLNTLLQEIAKNLKSTELDRIKILFRGPDGLGKKTLEKCETFIQLFDVLRERCFISRGNLVYLNQILYTLDRRDLIEKCAKYRRVEGNTVTFSKEEINDDGYTPVKIHLPADIRSIDMETIDRLRNNVAKIVCVPVELVRIAAIEPGSSLLVTFLIPDAYVTILQILLEEESKLWELVAVGVDTLAIGAKSYHLSGNHRVEIVETEQQKHLMNIYEQLEQTKEELRKLELQVIERSNEIHKLQEETEQRKNEWKKEIEALERKNKEHLTALSLLQRMFLVAPDGAKAMPDFQKAIAEANCKHQDMTVVKRLDTLVVSAYIRNLTKAERKQNEAILEEGKARECQLLHQVLTGALTALYTKYSRHSLGVPLGFNTPLLKVSDELSKCLTDEEMYHLMTLYSLEENDLIKQCIEMDRSLLLLGLMCKEAENTHEQVQIESFIKKVLREVQRFDLENRYTELLSHQRNVSLAEGTSFHVQSRIQTPILENTAVNEIHSVYETTGAMVELLIEFYDFLLDTAPRVAYMIPYFFMFRTSIILNCNQSHSHPSTYTPRRSETL